MTWNLSDARARDARYAPALDDYDDLDWHRQVADDAVRDRHELLALVDRLAGALREVEILAKEINSGRKHWVGCVHYHPWCEVQNKARPALQETER